MRVGVVRGRAIGVREACDRRELYGEPLSARALQIINPLPPDVFFGQDLAGLGRSNIVSRSKRNGEKYLGEEDL